MPMQLERLKHFVEALKADQHVLSAVEAIDIFRYYDEKWFDINDAVLEDDALCAQLLHVHEQVRHWRDTNSRVGLIDVLPYKAVAIAKFSAPPKRQSLERVHEKIEDARRHAEAAFDAVHDSLTGLLNTKGFRDAAQKVLARLESHTSNAAVSPEPDGPPASVVMFALDIDHFKQVNDTYGHMYGDVVLQCLAKRLAGVSKSLQSSMPGIMATCIARPSGEEFLILIAGSINSDRAKAFGEAIRTAVAGDPLPSDAEWELLASVEAKKNSPPAISDRKLTVSIGTSQTSAPKATKVDDSLDTLRSQADRALYSAKSGGRNVVRMFPEILSRFGRVLEHHPETNLVAIDLGRHVEIALGQEFKVFHPSFDGETDFVRNDGRSNKVLGRYPRTSVGRLEVMEVQQEISFCRVAERTCPGLFIPGSYLEAIPIGTISHLISSNTFGGVVPGLDLIPAPQLVELVIAASEGAVKPVTAVFSIDDVDSVAKLRGTAFVNATLAQLYAAIKEKLPLSSRVGLVQSTELATVMHIKSIEAKKIASEIIDSAKKRCKGLATFSSGLFVCPAEKEEAVKGDRSKMQVEHALDYARYAAADARYRGNDVSEFSVRTARNIILVSRNKQAYSQAIEDCKAFRALGIANASIENIAAICEFALPDANKELVLTPAKTAIDLDRTNALYWGNLAVYQYFFGEIDDAFTSIREAEKIGIDLNTDIYQGVAAMSKYKQLIDGGEITIPEVIESLSFALLRKLPAFNVTREEVEAALQTAKSMLVAPTIESSDGPTQPTE